MTDAFCSRNRLSTAMRDLREHHSSLSHGSVLPVPNVLHRTRRGRVRRGSGHRAVRRPARRPLRMELMIRVGVLRHTLFAPSEPFIPDQVAALPGVNATLISRDPIINSRPGLRAVALQWESSWQRQLYVGARRVQPLTSLLVEGEFKLLHAHFGVEGMYSRPAARSAGIPHVTTLHGFDVTMSRSALLRSRTPSWVHYALGRSAHLRSESTFVCVSEQIRRSAARLGLPEDRAVVIPTGVDTAALQPRALPVEPAVVHVARLVEKKGTADLLRAMAIVKNHVPEVRLTVVGDGPLREELRVLAEELGLARAVTFLGATRHAETIGHIGAARVLCAPSVTARSGDSEGLGQVLLEAGAMGKPVVATRHGGIPEAVVDGQTGLLVPERAPHELADALLEALKGGVGERLGEQGRRHVVEHFDVRAQAAKVAALYRRLI